MVPSQRIPALGAMSQPSCITQARVQGHRTIEPWKKPRGRANPSFSLEKSFDKIDRYYWQSYLIVK